MMVKIDEDGDTIDKDTMMAMIVMTAITAVIVALIVVI